MADSIGEVSINLRMSLVNFKKDVQDGTDAAKRSTKDLSDSVKGNIGEARGSLALLGEEIGVHLPRHLQTFIAGIPGVGPALTAAFSSVAVLALIEVVVKLAEKIEQFRAQAETMGNALRESGNVGAEGLRHIEEQMLSLDVQIETLRGNYLAALQKTLKEIDLTTLDNLSNEFKRAAAEAQTTFSDIKAGFIENVLSLGKDNSEIATIGKELVNSLQEARTFANQKDSQEAGAILDAAIQRVQFQLKASNDESVNRALKEALNTLEEQKTAYTEILQISTKQKELATANTDTKIQAEVVSETQARERETQEINALRAATLALTSGTVSETEKTIAKLSEEIEKWREKKATIEASYPGIKTYYDYEINALQTAKATQEEILATQQKMLAAGIVPGVQQKAPNLEGKDQQGIYGGTKEAQELYRVRTDANTSVAEAQKLYTSTRTAAEQLAQETAVYKELLAEGKISQDTYNRAMAEAKSRLDANTIAYQQLGQDIGREISQATLFGESWSDAFKNILVQLVQVIIKMEALKALQSAGVTGNGGFGGGFFGSLLSGLFGGGRAGGGGVQAGKVYEIGENGPELFAPGQSGTIIPNGGAGGATVVNNYQIDARGADIGVEQRIRQAMKETENKAVARAVVATQEIQKRRLA
jgi:hypothetical protein